MKAMASGLAAAAVMATGLLAPMPAHADPVTNRAKAMLSTPWEAECAVPACWNIRIASIPRKLKKGETFTVRVESRLERATTRRGADMNVVFLDVTGWDYSAPPEIEVVDVTVVRDGKRVAGAGTCTREVVLDPASGGNRLATVCSTTNPESRIWKGKETRVLRLKYRGGILRPIPEAASLSPGVFLQGLAQTTNLATTQVRVRYGL